MIYGSVCSGIEAATVAWHPLGWKAAWLSEIEKFPNLVLTHHYPDIPNLGDMTKIYANQTFQQAKIDLLVGGTPCQSFSVAGLRKGLDDPRGNLCLEFLRLVDIKRPRWFVWENVPGVLSSGQGRDFGSFLGAIQKLGYGFAYRILDAQYFGVPQRRRRVFVVGYFGDSRPSCAVLFERESLRGNPAKSPKTRQRIAEATISRALTSSNTATGRLDPNESTYICVTGDKTHTLKAEGFDASEDGTGRGQPIIAFSCKDSGLDAGEKSPTLRSMNFDKSHANAGGQVAIAIQERAVCENTDAGPDGAGFRTDNKAYTLESRAVPQATAFGSQVRRLTPRECERLQGFPDDYTLISTGKKPADGPRYKALGNSMAVPVMHWIGRRIQQVENILEDGAL